MHKMIFSLLFVSLSPGCPLAQSALFDLRKMADDVYAAIARPQYKTNSNALIVINEDGVLVVDSHSKPSAARALIAEVKKITDKPVKYVVNTHFHADHTRGNQSYPSAFPAGVPIISSEATRENLITLGIPSIRQQIENMPAEIEGLKKRIAAEKDSATRKALESDLAQAEEYSVELRSMQITLPDLTFDKSLILHKKNRDIVIMFLGRGHTSGDALVYLPKEKIIATGDLIHGWWPFMSDSYPPEWIKTLDQLETLNFNVLIGGHGDVKPKSHIPFFRECIAASVEETRKALQRGETLDEAKKSVPAALAKCAAGLGEFQRYIAGGVQKLYKDIEAKKY